MRRLVYLFGVFGIVISQIVMVPHADAFSLLGSGTPSDPYQISNCAQLHDINDHPNANYKLTDDIDCSSESTGDGFLPIANPDETSFSGVFDGDHRVISNLKINRPTENYAGLFGILEGGEIKNLTLLQPDVTGSTNAGALVAYGSTATNTITNITITSPTVTARQVVGGLVGDMTNAVISRIKITDAIINGTEAAGTSNDQGGLAGAISNATVSEVHVTGTVTGNTIDNTEASYSGGVVGQDLNNNVYTDIYSDVDVTGGNQVGGILGNMLPLSTMENAVSVGDIYAARTNSSAGGLVGIANGGTIEKSVSMSVVDTLTTDYEGGLIGKASTGYVTQISAFWDIVVSEAADCIAIDEGSAGTCYAINNAGIEPDYFQFRSNAPMNSWDFDSTWKENTSALPSLTFISPPSTTVNATSTSSQMNITWASDPGIQPYHITEIRYKIYGSSEPWVYKTIASPETTSSTIITGLTANKEYVFETHFVNDQGVGGWTGFIKSTDPSSPVTSVSSSNKLQIPVIYAANNNTDTTEPINTISESLQTSPDSNTDTSDQIMNDESSSFVWAIYAGIGAVLIFILIKFTILPK